MSTNYPINSSIFGRNFANWPDGIDEMRAKYAPVPDIWLEDLGYDQRPGRLCFHGKCPMPPPCVRLELCIGAQSFVYQQANLWEKHQQPSPCGPIPYAFWLGAENPLDGIRLWDNS